MSFPFQFLQEARLLLIRQLGNEITEDELDEVFSQLKVQFKGGMVLYIRYNEYQEYGYQIVYSLKKGDQVRFDNFDDRWPVTTRPHHFHERGGESVRESPMSGNPSQDIPILIEFIQRGTLP